MLLIVTWEQVFTVIKNKLLITITNIKNELLIIYLTHTSKYTYEKSIWDN